VLSKLREYRAQATFFCVGENVVRNAHIFSEIKRQGHSIGNHTHNHLNGWKTPFFSYVENTELAHGFIDSGLFRPPHGKLTMAQRNALSPHYKIVLWDVLSKDYDQRLSPTEVYQNVVRYSGPGSVVVFHDSIKASRNLFRVLPRVLDYYSELGYSFSPIFPNTPF
jgi:peptidoglycan/xylan/chitin deacetylase (PgdA/CDA1 family)